MAALSTLMIRQWGNGLTPRSNTGTRIVSIGKLNKWRTAYIPAKLIRSERYDTETGTLPAIFLAYQSISERDDECALF
jgi:hypothetical protein